MNPALTSHVLVDEHNSPVPLPFHSESGQCITGFDPPRTSNSSGRVHTARESYFPDVFDLRIITENEFMAAQAGQPPFYLIEVASGQPVTLPHYLSDDHTVTSIDAECLVCETTRSLVWLDPAKYGLRIVAYCDLP